MDIVVVNRMPDELIDAMAFSLSFSSYCRAPLNAILAGLFLAICCSFLLGLFVIGRGWREFFGVLFLVLAAALYFIGLVISDRQHLCRGGPRDSQSQHESGAPSPPRGDYSRRSVEHFLSDLRLGGLNGSPLPLSIGGIGEFRKIGLNAVVGDRLVLQTLLKVLMPRRAVFMSQGR